MPLCFIPLFPSFKFQKHLIEYFWQSRTNPAIKRKPANMAFESQFRIGADNQTMVAQQPRIMRPPKVTSSIVAIIDWPTILRFLQVFGHHSFVFRHSVFLLPCQTDACIPPSSAQATKA